MFIALTGGSWGLQAGAQSSDIILVFTTKGGIEGITGGKLTLGADASVAAGPVGRQGSAATDVSLAEIYSYARTRGLFGGIETAERFLTKLAQVTHTVARSSPAPQAEAPAATAQTPAPPSTPAAEAPRTYPLDNQNKN